MIRVFRARRSTTARVVDSTFALVTLPSFVNRLEPKTLDELQKLPGPVKLVISYRLSGVPRAAHGLRAGGSTDISLPAPLDSDLRKRTGRD